MMESVRDHQAAWDAFTQAQKELERHPSILSMELGWKVAAGQLQSQLAVRVYVERKLPLDQVPVDLRIPATIAGLPTDVINQRDECFDGHDMIGGDKITRIVWNEDGSASGTLGYIATRSAAPNEAVMLSNDHVFRNDLGAPAIRREVFQPDISRCMGSVCNRVGYVSDGFIGDFAWAPGGGSPADFFVDCSIGTIVDSDFDRGVKGIPNVTGSQDITGSPTGPGSTPIAVKKVGATTKLTQGVVVSVNSTGHQQVGPFEIEDQPLTILIRTTNGPMFDETFTVEASEKNSIITTFNNLAGPGSVTDLGSNRLRFLVPTFSQGGDSGSVVVTASGAVVGLLYGSAIFLFSALENGVSVRKSIPLGESRACHIGPVMARMGIRIDPATATSAGQASLAPGTAIGSDVPDDSLRSQIDALEEQVCACDRGRLLCQLIRDFGREIVDLVHHRRKVTVAWHRHEGPALAALVVNAIRDPKQTLPVEYHGKTLKSLLRRMADVLTGEGSPALAAMLNQHRSWLLDWLAQGDRVAELVVALKQPGDRGLRREGIHV